MAYDDYKTGTLIDSRWNRFLRRLGFYRPPVIMVNGQPMADWARRLAARNMKEFADVKERVEELIGIDEAKKRYPEAY